MSQTKIESLIESLVNVVIGLVVGLATQLITFYFYDIKVSWATTLSLLGWFTIASIARSYIVRRWFNERLRRGIHNITQSIEVAK